MKIAMLVMNNFLYDARVHKEAKTLAAHGHQVTVFALYDSTSPEHATQDGYHIHRLDIQSRNWRDQFFMQFIRYIEFVWMASRAMVRFQPEVCHAHAIQALIPCWLVHFITGCKFVYDSHEYEQGVDFRSGTRIPKLMRRFWHWPEKLLIHLTDSVITVSDSLADTLAGSYSIDRPIVIRNCPESIPTQTSTGYLRDNYEIPDDWPIVLYQGILTEGRGLIELVESAHALSNIAIVIAGSGLLVEKLMEASSKVHINTKIIFTGSISMQQLPEVTASASVGVVLTQNTCLNHFYSLPNKLFEYIQAGLPVIGSNIPEIRGIIQEYEIGVVVDPTDPKNIAWGIQQILESKRYKMACKNTARVAKIFNWEAESQKLIDLYREMEVTP